ncbi:MAG: hypothetical protein QOE03_2817 [Micromonosporaceae bacterium]|nr:hypothetical protein [Micromonosporaceae bacterium]
MALTGGTLRPVAETLMADGNGRVGALMRVRGTRPDGRTFDLTWLTIMDSGRSRHTTSTNLPGQHN